MISKVFISKVRSLESMDCNFDAGINVICGPNGCGKTTILESIHLLAQGFSFRSRDLRELITWKNNELILRGEFEDEGRTRMRAIRVYSRGSEVRENGESLKSPTSFFGTCPAVIMQPSDIELLRGGPEVRRHWLDEILCYRSSANAQVLRRYKRVLQQRNKWLKEFKQNGAAVGGEDLFRVLTQQLIELGAKLWAARIALSKEVSEIITRYYRKLSGGVDEITCAFRGIEGLRSRFFGLLQNVQVLQMRRGRFPFLRWSWVAPFLQVGSTWRPNPSLSCQNTHCPDLGLS